MKWYYYNKEQERWIECSRAEARNYMCQGIAVKQDCRSLKD